VNTDCETVAVVFKQPNSCCGTPKTPNTAEEIRKSIYEFQNQLDQEERKQLKTPSSNRSSNQNLVSLDDEYEEYRTRVKMEKKLRQSGSLPELKGAEETSENTTIWTLNPTSIFFKTPKPVRPQLHAFF
jgi:Sec-independent protein translocase protein TatA